MTNINIDIIQPNNQVIPCLNYSCTIIDTNNPIDQVKQKVYEFIHITENKQIYFEVTFPQPGKLKSAFPTLQFEPDTSYFYEGYRLDKKVFIAIKNLDKTLDKNKWEALIL